MNKFYKVSDSYGTKLVKFDNALGNDPYGKEYVAQQRQNSFQEIRR